MPQSNAQASSHPDSSLVVTNAPFLPQITSISLFTPSEKDFRPKQTVIKPAPKILARWGAAAAALAGPLDAAGCASTGCHTLLHTFCAGHTGPCLASLLQPLHLCNFSLLLCPVPFNTLLLLAVRASSLAGWSSCACCPSWSRPAC